MESILKDILRTLYSDTIQSLIFAAMATFIVVYFRREGVRKGISIWIEELKKSSGFVYELLFFFYLYLMASRTLFNRDMVWAGWTNVLGGWWIELQQDGTIVYQSIENVVLFIPFIFLMYCAFGAKIKKDSSAGKFKYALYISGMSSIFIEMNQLIFRVGTFQIADIVYNILGGILGCALYLIITHFRGKTLK